MKTKKDLLKENRELQLENLRLGLQLELHQEIAEMEKAELEKLKEERNKPSFWPLVLIMLLFSSINKDKEEKENGES